MSSSLSSSVPIRTPFTTHNRRNRENVLNTKVPSDGDGSIAGSVDRAHKSKPTGKQSKYKNNNLDVSTDSIAPPSSNDKIDQPNGQSQEFTAGAESMNSERDEVISNQLTRSVGEEHVSSSNLSSIFRTRLIDTSAISCFQQLQPATSITEYSDDDDDDTSIDNEIESSSRYILPILQQQPSSNILFWDDCIFSTSDIASTVRLGDRSTLSNISNGNSNSCILQFR